MRALLLLAVLAGAGYLAYDDYLQREALKQSQLQIQQLQQQLQGQVGYVPRVQSTPAPPTWFQRHLNQGSALDPSQRHKRP